MSRKYGVFYCPPKSISDSSCQLERNIFEKLFSPTIDFHIEETKSLKASNKIYFLAVRNSCKKVIKMYCEIAVLRFTKYNTNAKSFTHF